MEFKKLEQNKRSKIIICFTVLILLLITIVLMVSKAKYQVTKNVQIVNGTINYVPYDFKIVEIRKENDDGRYEITDEVPTTGYEIDEQESKCMTDENQKDTGAILKTIDGKHTFANLKKMDKCTLYFKIIPKPLTPTERLENLNLKVNTTSEGCPTETNPTISEIEDSRTLLCKGQDDYGETYYFRGVITNNWVKIGATLWRIIRINGDGTIRLIYNSNYKTIEFNSQNNRAEYVGLKYTEGSKNGNNTPSTILGTLESFYNDNFGIGKPLENYAKYIDTDAGFCGDRTLTSGPGTGREKTVFAPYTRITSTHKPIFKCPDKSNDLYTVSESKIGNHALTNPVGLITVDEVIYAGGNTTYNGKYWLKGSHYWTMSPSDFPKGYAQVYAVSGGTGDGLTNPYVDATIIGVRPVINLKADTRFTGSGISGDPFVVQ